MPTERRSPHIHWSSSVNSEVVTVGTREKNRKLDRHTTRSSSHSVTDEYVMERYICIMHPCTGTQHGCFLAARWSKTMPVQAGKYDKVLRPARSGSVLFALALYQLYPPDTAVRIALVTCRPRPLARSETSLQLFPNANGRWQPEMTTCRHLRKFRLPKPCL